MKITIFLVINLLLILNGSDIPIKLMIFLMTANIYF